ncbi:MAG: hypothetical protein IK135_01615 [Bacteroidales bacterium]|nr:hypothetical protein [Bacteroidales bacterium]
MKKVFITMALCMAFVGLAQAQLSEGETYASRIVTGNRPQAGDWGLYFGPSLSEVKDLLDSEIQVSGFPLINLKYYATDNLEIRAGIQYAGKTTKAQGNYNEEYYLDDEEIVKSIPLTDNFYSRAFRVSPGIAYHFSPKNILDVYVGAAIPVGVDAQKSVYETQDYMYEDENLVSRNHKNNSYYNSFVLGLNAFIGLQAFVADLPLSIGFEYGLSGMLRTNNQVYHEVTDYDGNLQQYYTGPDQYQHFTKLDCSSKYMNNDVRLTITYYFNNK